MRGSMIFLAVAAILGPARPALADVDFTKDVKPILEGTCLRCHNPEKAKGKLRMDTRELFLKGSENGPVIVVGKPDESKLFKLVNQPKTSEDRMPPEGEPLTKAQIDTLQKWIAEGGKWPDGMTLKSTGSAAAVTPTAIGSKDDPGVPISEAEKAAVTKLQAGGVLAIRLAQNTNLIRVDFSLRGKDVKDDELAVLKNIPNLTELGLGGTIINDASLVHLKPLTNLTRLNLHDTKISDVGLMNLQGMTKLQSLNVYGTPVTDKGLESLANLKSLKHLYVWQTKVSADGAKKLCGAVKGLDVDRGYEAPPPAPPVEPMKPKDAPKKPPEVKKPEKKEEPKKPEKKEEVKKP